METIIPLKRCYRCDSLKPLTEFHKHKSRSDGVKPECKACIHQIDVQRNRDRSNSPTMGMRAAGLSRKEYLLLHEQQDGKCAICGKPETSRNQHGKKSLAVDHDHTTGEFRGLLCQMCNTKLAVLEDAAFMKAAVVYLKRHADALRENPPNVPPRLG